MAEYRLGIAILEGTGVITVDGGVPLQYYEEGTSLTVATTLGPGFVSVEWSQSPNNSTVISSSLSFTFVMPAADTRLSARMSGTYAPINGYGLKYFVEYGSIEGACKRLEILQDGYGGLSSEIQVGEIEFGWGNQGDDVFKTVIGSYLDFEIAGGIDDYLEFIKANNRTYQAKYYEDKDDTTPFFEGYISPDFITIRELSGTQLQKFTAIDGLKGFDSIRAELNLWIGVGATPIRALVGALNQTFVDGRNVNLAAKIHETRMDDTLNLWEQFATPYNCLYNEGRDISYLDGTRIVNETLFLEEVIERLVNPFLCKVYLWRNEFWIVRTPQLAELTYKYYKYGPDAIQISTPIISNGVTDVSCIIDLPEKTSRRVFTEFTAILNMGVLDPTARGGIISMIENVDDWFVGSATSPFPGVYKLRRFDYVRAIPSLQPTSVPSSTTALVQYDTTNEAAKIWASSANTGTADPNISYISINQLDSGEPIGIAQETANTLSVSFEYQVQPISGDTATSNLGNYRVGVMIIVGDRYIEQTGPTTFAFTLTETIITIPIPSQRTFNTFTISNLLVPVDGAVEVRLYQIICVAGTAHLYAVLFRNLKLSIEENEALVLSQISTKAITDQPFSNVHPDYETWMGDAETNNSTSAIKLTLAGNPVSENWSRDGVESEPLMDLLVTDLSNLKGRSNVRILGTVMRQEVVPYQSVMYNNQLYMVISIKLDTYRNKWQVELFELGIIPST